MATSSFSKTFVLADSSCVDTLIELDKAPCTIKTRERDDKAESQKAVRAFSKVLSKKNVHN